MDKPSIYCNKKKLVYNKLESNLSILLQLKKHGGPQNIEI